jgi:hypothetical protein
MTQLKSKLWFLVSRRVKRQAFVLVVGPRSHKINRCIRDFVAHLGGDVRFHRFNSWAITFKRVRTAERFRNTVNGSVISPTKAVQVQK